MGRLAEVLDKQLCFIVGLTRPGTIWMQHALDAHPDACCKGEGHFTDALFPILGGAFGEYNRRQAVTKKQLEAAGIGAANPGPPAGFTNNDASFLMSCAGAIILSRWAGAEDLRCIGEKTAEHAMALDDLIRVFPNAKIVHVVRDGRDEAVSVYDYNIRAGGDAFLKEYSEFSDFLENFAGNWNRAVGAARLFGRSHPGNYVEVNSEDLHSEAAADVARVFRFLDLDDSDEVAAHCIESARRIALPDGIIGQWKERFDESSKKIFIRHGGELLKLLGYET